MIYDILAILYFVGCIVGLWFIFKKAGEKPWAALIPIYNIVVWIRVVGKSWKWYVYCLIPAINFFTFLMLVVETAKTFRRYGFWEQTFGVICPWIYLPVLGLSKKMAYTNPAQLPPHKISEARDWLDSIVFAVIAAVVIRGYIFELYLIPSSSMEKSLLTGDRLMVSKIAYGPRVDMTPLSVPLVHNVLPLTQGRVESYLDWIQLPYHRFVGRGHVERFDATVFNYPDGDTVCTAFQSNRSYHDLVRKYGRQRVLTDVDHFGKIRVRPVNKKENFIKRTIGLPGETIQIVNRQVLIDGAPIETPAHAQFTYAVRTQQSLEDYISSMSAVGASPLDAQRMKYENDWKLFSTYGVSLEDWNNSTFYMYLPADSLQLQTIRQYDAWFNVDVLQPGDDPSKPFLVRLVPDYGVSNSEAELRQRDYELQQALGKMTSELVSCGMSETTIVNAQRYYTLPLPADRAQALAKDERIASVTPIVALEGYSGLDLFPHHAGYAWSVDNFGPVQIPAKGLTVPLNEETLPLYRRAIADFEHNTVSVEGGQVYINGEPATQYTFKMDYYWMMGDNRHNSADSRYWGFVPEDHIVGKAAWILSSKDKEQPRGKRIRWNRFMRRASSID